MTTPKETLGGDLVGMEGFEPTQLLVNRFTVCRASPSAPHPHCRDGQYVVEFELVCAAGFEPATPCAQDTCATTALRTEIGGRGRATDFMLIWIIHTPFCFLVGVYLRRVRLTIEPSAYALVAGRGNAPRSIRLMRPFGST